MDRISGRLLVGCTAAACQRILLSHAWIYNRIVAESFEANMSTVGC